MGLCYPWRMLGAWKRLISDPDYDPVLSELVAVMSCLSFGIAYLICIAFALLFTLGGMLLHPIAGLITGYLALVFLCLAWMALRQELRPDRISEQDHA